ncbi:DUF2520 domain-containing protein [Lewinella sp. IMCC34191]|uniref:DUF2520 domain-containing protein n=1 Tax=Lewinella sp. IMCC34191 TaxID=2259172 RepID=UPI0013006B7B|nr:DUF2520 domain-containing protein [Lewinella sp. IMCC34191]
MKYAIIGSGNLAWHLAGVLGRQAVVIYREQQPVESWPVDLLPLEAVATQNWDALFLAVPDEAIRAVSQQLAAVLPADLPVIHTSGATPLDRIDAQFRHRGVLWPIRSLRKGEIVADWNDLPLVLQADTQLARRRLTEIAGDLSQTVTWLNDRQRAQLHLAAVFSNNFVTALYEVAFQLCASCDVPFDLLLPIIRNTAGRQDGSRPADRQTGAAARGDYATMDRHLELIDRETYQNLYRDISALILEYRLPQHDTDFRGEPDDDL